PRGRGQPIPDDPHGRDQPSSRPRAGSTSPPRPPKGLENMPSRRSADADIDEFLREKDAGIGYAVRVAGCDPRGRYSPHASRIRTARNRVALHLGSASRVARTSPLNLHWWRVRRDGRRCHADAGGDAPCGAETPLPAGAPPTGRRALRVERPKRVETPFGPRRFDDHSRRHRLDPAVARPRGSTMTTTAQNTTSSDQNSQAPITDEEIFAAHEGGKLSAELTSPLETQRDLSIAYTPGVAKVCTAIKDEPQMARTHTWTGRLVAVVSDGSAVLGLGDIGPAASLPVMEGKCALFKSFSGINAIPIVLDTNDTDEIVETIVRMAPTFGAVNLEDISAPRCFEIEDRVKEALDIPVMHD